MDKSAVVALAGVVTSGAVAGVQRVELAQTRLEHTINDFGDTTSLDIDVTGDGVEDLTFEIFQGESGGLNEAWLSGIDFTRNGGFLTSFDDNDNGVFQEFNAGDTLGPANEDDIGFETRTYAQYDLDDFGSLISGGSLAGRTAYIGFGLFDAEPLPGGGTNEGNRYGYMLVEFGPLRAIDLDNPAYIEILEVGIGGINAEFRIPAPGGALAMAALGLVARRRR
ncbi:MAG: hypothetical protein AAGI53_09960 [Planctomycetota bacterium]